MNSEAVLSNTFTHYRVCDGPQRIGLLCGRIDSWTLWCNEILHFFLQGSEAAYIYGCIILCSIPLLLACAAYGVVKLMNSRRRKMKQIREELNNNSGPGRKQGRYSVHS